MPDWLSWDFWAKDSQSLNHLALIIAGVIGIPLLAIRTFAANRSARAALEQAKAANQSAAAAFEQAKTAAERHDEQTRADRERRITESFAKAVEQLGSDKLETRLGAIYTLERIAQESEREYWPIMETLTAFIRERAPWPPRQAVINPFVELQSSTAESTCTEQLESEAEPARVKVRPATDIQAVLTVLGRRDEEACQQDEAKGRRLDLTATDLRGADLKGTHLERTFFTGTNLEGADLAEAYLEGASFAAAKLEGARLVGAHLEDTYFCRRLLEFLAEGGDPMEATGLSQEQLDALTSGDDRTLLPRGLRRPSHWRR